MKTGTINQLGVVMQPGMMIRRSSKNIADNFEKNQTSQINFNLKIIVKELKIAANIGVYNHEKGKFQELIIDIEIEVKNNNLFANDELENTIDYVYLANLAQETANLQHFNLIETFGQFLAKAILKDDRIEKLILKITKPSAIKNAHSAQVMLECAR